LSQGAILKVKGAHWPLYRIHQPTLRKNLRNDSESRRGWLNQNPKSPEKNLKNTQKQQPTKSKGMLKPKYKISRKPVFTFGLPGWQFIPLSLPVTPLAMIYCNYIQ